ncbi:MAG: hypothetical protein ACYDCQ_08875 [Dehalococcoidia bacterium]
MRIHKRVTALLSVAALTAALGFAAQGVPFASAATPTHGAIGCANSSSPADIRFATGGGGVISGAQVTSAVAPATLSLANPAGSVICGVVLQDSDFFPNNVAGGSVTFTVSGPALIDGAATPHTVPCGGVGLNTCQGGVPAVGIVSPDPGNTVFVTLQPGVTFPMFGGASPVITITATYTRFGPPGSAGPFSTTIGVTTPSYNATVTPTPAIVPAAMGSTTGSTVAVDLFHAASAACVPIAPGSPILVCGVALPGLIVPGAESGAVTFHTSSGVFQNQAQVFTAHCGAVPGSAPGFNMSACLTASATLFGGGAAGTANIEADFVGDYTGAVAQAFTTVALSASPATVSLTTGCNQVLTPDSMLPGTTGVAVAALAQPAGAVSSIWAFDNATHGWDSLYFGMASAPVDVLSVGPHQSLLVCVNGAATFPA